MGKLVAGAMVVAAFTAVQAPRPSTDVSYSRQTLILFGVSNLNRAIEFYTKVLGFTLTERRDDLEFAHIETNVPGLQIGLNPVPDTKGTGSAILNIGVTDIVAARGCSKGVASCFAARRKLSPVRCRWRCSPIPMGTHCDWPVLRRDVER